MVPVDYVVDNWLLGGVDVPRSSFCVPLSPKVDSLWISVLLSTDPTKAPTGFRAPFARKVVTRQMGYPSSTTCPNFFHTRHHPIPARHQGVPALSTLPTTPMTMMNLPIRKLHISIHPGSGDTHSPEGRSCCHTVLVHEGSTRALSG